MEKYQFDLSQPYLLHQRKESVYLWIIVATVPFMAGILLEECMLGILLSIVLAFSGIDELKSKDKVMQINRQGITTSTEGTIHWSNMKRCFYHYSYSTHPEKYLKIILKSNVAVNIRVSEYAFDSKKLSAAIDFYAGRGLFGRIKQDDKDEMKWLLAGSLFACVLILYIILLIAISL